MMQWKCEVVLKSIRKENRMSDNGEISLQKMRREREKYESIYLKFVNYKRYYEGCAFCFYEGEDGKYYDSRIRNIFDDKFVTYVVGNKKEVLKLLNKITSTKLYDDVCTMFFVDRDFDDNSLLRDNDRLFITSGYSIENFYVQKECLIKILQSEFGLNKMDSDCQKCLRDFEKREEEFNDQILEYNALLYLQKRNPKLDIRFSFASIKTCHMLKVSIEKVDKAERYENIINNIKSGLEQSKVEKAKRELIEQGNFSLNFRGKNQMDFFVDFIKCLKAANKQGKYFEERHNNIHINLTANRLSELSQYAITPEELKNFLQKNKLKYQLM